MIFVILMYALCASSFTIAKAVLQYATPIFFIGVRTSLAGLLLCSFAWMRNISLRIHRQDFVPFFLLSILGGYVAYVFDLWSLQFMTSFKSAFFFNLSPFITALLGYIFLRERLTGKQWVGLVIGFLSLLPMLLQYAPQESFVQGLTIISWPEIILLLSVAGSCFGWIIMKHLLRKGYHVVSLNGIAMFYAGILALITSFFTEVNQFGVLPVSNWYMFVLLTLAIIFLCNILFSNVYGYLLQHYSATFLSFAGFLCPLFTAFFGIIFLAERVTWHFVAGLVGVSIGLYIFYQDELSFDWHKLFMK